MGKWVATVMAVSLAGWLQSATAADIYNATFIPIKEPDCIYNRFFAESTSRRSTTPFNEFNLIVRYLGDNAVAREVFYPVGVYTGFTPRRGEPLTQRGEFDLPPPIGSSAFQLDCMAGGMMINTWTFPYGLNPPGAGPHAVFEYTWTIPRWSPLTPDLDPRARAWAYTARSPWRTATSDLVVQASLRAAWFLPRDRDDVPGSPVAQLSITFILRNQITGGVLPYIVLVYDNRESEVFSEGVGCDESLSPCLPFVSTRFLDTLTDPTLGSIVPLRYATKSPYSASSRATLWDELRFFRVHISRTNLLNAIAASNEVRRLQGGELLPAVPEEYLLVQLGILSEVFYNKRDGAEDTDADARDNLSFGVSFYGLGAYEAR